MGTRFGQVRGSCFLVWGDLISRNPFQGLAKWIALSLRERIKKNWHVCESSDDVIRKLRSRTFSPDILLLHFDVDDFYMVGEHSFCARHASPIIGNPDLRDVVREAIHFVLMYQYAVSSALKDRVFQQVLGLAW